MNFEDMEKNREEELRKKAEEEKKQRYNENKRSFREAKRRSVVEQVGIRLNKYQEHSAQIRYCFGSFFSVVTLIWF